MENKFTAKLKEKNSINYIEKISIDSKVLSLICIFDLSYQIDNKKLVEDINNFRKAFPKSMLEYNKDSTFVRSWHSDFKTQRMTNLLDNLIALKKEKIVQGYRLASVELLDIWINMYTSQDSALRHSHGPFGISTVYFPSVEKNSTPLIFDNNNRPNFNKKEIIPKPGMLICFPSHLYHHVPSVKEISRISIASNFNVLNSTTEERNPFLFQEF